MLEDIASLIVTWGIISLIFFAGGCTGWAIHKMLAEEEVDDEEDMMQMLRSRKCNEDWP